MVVIVVVAPVAVGAAATRIPPLKRLCKYYSLNSLKKDIGDYCRAY